MHPALRDTVKFYAAAAGVSCFVVFLMTRADSALRAEFSTQDMQGPKPLCVDCGPGGGPGEITATFSGIHGDLAYAQGEGCTCEALNKEITLSYAHGCGWNGMLSVGPGCLITHPLWLTTNDKGGLWNMSIHNGPSMILDGFSCTSLKQAQHSQIIFTPGNYTMGSNTEWWGACDFSNVAVTLEAKRWPSYCGNGIVESREICEPKNLTLATADTCPALHYCSSECSKCQKIDLTMWGWWVSELCNNKKLDVNEACDLSAGVDCKSGTCNKECKCELRFDITSECGNGITEMGEGCDDKNRKDNDGCSATCKKEMCGDGILQPPRETCDYRGENTNRFGLDCRRAPHPTPCTALGDGVAQTGEQCGEPGLNCPVSYICNNGYCQWSPGEGGNPPPGGGNGGNGGIGPVASSASSSVSSSSLSSADMHAAASPAPTVVREPPGLFMRIWNAFLRWLGF